MTATLTQAARSHYLPKNAHPKGLVETPYVRARKEWDLRMGTTVVQARSWRLNSMVLSALLGASLLGNVYQGTQPKAVPHIIEIDALGEARYRGAVGESAASFTPSEALVRYQLRRWIDLTRTISSDNVLLRKNQIDAWNMLAGVARARMDELMNESSPFVRAQKETTAVEILSAVPLSAESWQIDWKETTWDKSGQAVGKPVIWRAMLKTFMQRPKTRQEMLDNPLGLFVTEFHWDRIGGGK